MILVNPQLNGAKQGMKRVLLSQNKLKFIDGSIAPPQSS